MKIKKLFLRILLGCTFLVTIPMSALRMPSFNVQAAKERLDHAKNRVVKAMKTNRKTQITVAVGGLLAALAAFEVAKRRSASTIQLKGAPLKLEEESESEEEFMPEDPAPPLPLDDQPSHAPFSDIPGVPPRYRAFMR